MNTEILLQLKLDAQEQYRTVCISPSDLTPDDFDVLNDLAFSDDEEVEEGIVMLTDTGYFIRLHQVVSTNKLIYADLSTQFQTIICAAAKSGFRMIEINQRTTPLVATLGE